MNVLVLHGPTLQFLGLRRGIPPGLTLPEVDRRLAEKARALGHVLRTVQSNHEGALVDALWEQRTWAEGVVLNPGPLAPGSHVLRAAVSASRMPVVEVLLAPAKGRAAAQRRSLLREVCAAHVAGTGAEAYLEALERLSRAASRAAAARTTKTLGRAPEVGARASRQIDRPAATAGHRPDGGRRRPPAAPAARTPARAPVAATPPATTRAGKTLGPARDATQGRDGPGDPAGAARGSGPGKTLGRADALAAHGHAASGRGPHAGRGALADRRPSGRRLTPAGLATWARGEWVALQRGAAVEAGQRDQLEEVLQALFLSVQPKGALSEDQLVEWMAALE